jgi:hypothetical protein
MATTTNYGWTTPDDTALVKDGAAAIRTLGTSVDTTTKNLNPSTTLGDIEYRSSTANTNTRLGIGSSGQNLSVVAGVPAWAASPTSVLTTTGDTLYASAANTLARLGVGTTGQVLTVAGGLPSWAAPAAAGKVLQVVQATKLDSTTTTSGSFVSAGLQVSITPSSATSKVLILSNFTVTGDTNTQPYYKLVKNTSTDLFIGDAAGSRPRVSGGTYVNNGNYITNGNVMFLDSPATTSATTYDIYIRTESPGSTVGFNRSVTDANTANYGARAAASIIALEIGA